MKTKSNVKVNFGMILLAITLTASLVLSIFPAGSVQAAGSPSIPISDETTPSGDNGEGPGVGVLEKALRLELKAHENLSGLLVKAGKAVIRLEEAIAKGQANERDVSALEKALKELKEQIRTARVSHDRVADLLADPAGFDTNGKVIDPRMANETIKEIHRSQQGIRRSIGETLKDTFKAIREYCQDNALD